MNGIIIINKPSGLTSHGAVQEVRKIFPQVRAGHSGTLDPMATGVLPVCLGRATRLVEYIIELPKTYLASIILGKTTDTEDATGRLIQTAAVPELKLTELEAILQKFTGKITQIPPLYSAVKYRGKPLYHWTRKGENVPRRQRIVNIYGISLLGYNPNREPQLVIKIECSRGTYIRTLAADIGRETGCGAHLSSLTRTAVGPYRLEDALTPLELKEKAASGRPEEYLVEPDTALQHLPAVALDQYAITALRHGKVVDLNTLDIAEKPETDAQFKVYDDQGKFKAIATIKEDQQKRLILKTVKYLA